MATMVVWQGTTSERDDLLNAIARNCDCKYGLMGVRVATCAPHTALVEDQHWLNHMVFARRLAVRLQHEEWHVKVQ